MFNFESATSLLWNRAGRALAALLAALLLSPVTSYAADTECAKVKIEIQQELTMERQGFDAMMKITNGLTTTSLDNVNITFPLLFHQSMRYFGFYPSGCYRAANSRG